MLTTMCAGLMAMVLVSIAARGADPAPTNDAGAPPAASAAATEPQASIPFANRGGIYDWRVIDTRTVLIESLDRQWYKATLMSSCFDLPFAQRIGFQTNPDGSFDKFSAIKLRSQYCPLTSLVKTAPPTKKAKRQANAEVTTAAGPGSAPAPATSMPPASAPPPH